MKDIRCVVDCTEFQVQTSRNYAMQGNTYSYYKHANTFKCPIDVVVHALCLICLKAILMMYRFSRECGIMKHIRPHDVILTDRGFTVQDLLNPLQAVVKIPSFLKGRSSLSAAEKLSTRKIAKARNTWNALMNV